MKKSMVIFLAFALLLTGCGDSSNIAAESPTWQEQYDLGVRYLSECNYEEAIIAFTVAIEIDPKQAPAYVGRGDAYVGLGEMDENLKAAQADYEQAIELDETNADAYFGLANVYISQKEYNKALETLRQGYEVTHIKQFLDLENHIQSQIDKNENAWIFTDNMVRAEELTVGGVPFWESTIERTAELFPNGENVWASGWIVNNTKKSYTQYLNDISVVSAQQMIDSPGLNSINFSSWKDRMAVANYTELREIRFGNSKQEALEILGLSDAGIGFCMAFEPSKVLRFVCTEGKWTEDIEHAGTVSPGSVVEFIWTNFNSGQEMILSLQFDESDLLDHITYHFMDLKY